MTMKVRAGLALAVPLLLAAAATAARGEGDARRQTEATTMSEEAYSLQGRTIRWTFDDGPMAGTTFEHTFGRDSTVRWRAVDGPAKGASGRARLGAAVPVTDTVHAVSYLGASGHTLTVILDLGTGTMIGFASDAETWQRMSGTFSLAPEREE